METIKRWTDALFQGLKLVIFLSEEKPPLRVAVFCLAYEVA